MATVRGFGGRISSGQEHEVVPHGCHLVRTGRWPIWTVGEWTRTEIRTVGVGDRQVTVFGECAATDPELHRLAAHGVTNGVLTAFAGSYTVVESTAHRTTVFTDPGHARPIYISDTAGGVVWGSSALALAALTNAQPDIGWLGTALLVPQRPDLLTGRSAFVDITSVPPGSRLVLANDAPPQVRAAWNPAPPRASLAEGAVLLRTALSDAVAVRIDSSRHPSVDCSGGMDSTSLALLAAGRLDNQRCLHAVTIHPAGTTRGGDLDYARMATEGRPAIRHLLCPLDSRHLPYSRMAGLMPPTDEPAPTTVAIARAVAEFDLLRKIGSDCHLTGDGGDTLLGGHPANLADLAQARRIGLLYRQAVGWARLRRTSVWPLLADTYATAVRQRRGSPRTLRPETVAAWSTTTARELVAEAMAAPAVPARESVSIGAQLTAEAIQTVGRTARSDAQVAEHYGVRVHNPFTDPQVIAACLAVLTWLRGSPYGYKPLLSAALADLLPPPIAARHTKGDFTPDHYLGLRANATVLRELADGRLAERGLVDPDRLRRLLGHAAAGLPVTFSDFEPALAAEIWLHAVDTAPVAARWQPRTPGMEKAAS